MTSSYSQEEIRELIERDSAIEQLEEMGAENPSTAIEEYIASVPDLLEWFDNNGREYPWRKTSDTWKILIAEIFLQRTRADAVSEVFPGFVEKYPDPESLYTADEQEVKSQIKSLGFVNQRTETLKALSRLLVEEYNGSIPENIDELKQSWRIGEYVVRAVKIFAREEPIPLVDSNIARIIGRTFDIDLPDQPHKSDELYELMDYLTPKGPKVTQKYYLALIDLGALVCTTENPDHDSCPFRNLCD